MCSFSFVLVFGVTEGSEYFCHNAKMASLRVRLIYQRSREDITAPVHPEVRVKVGPGHLNRSWAQRATQDTKLI